MGEIAEMMLGGILCQHCGVFLDVYEECGFPMSCSDCDDEQKKPLKIKLTSGEKRFRQRVRKILIENGFSNITEIHPWAEIIKTELFDSEIRRQQHHNNEIFKEKVLSFFHHFFVNDLGEI